MCFPTAGSASSVSDQPPPPPAASDLPASQATSPAERLRALELTGDPDAQKIARRYKAGPADPLAATHRQVRRAVQAPLRLLTPSYARATEADADEAEVAYAAVRTQRADEARKRDAALFAFAAAGDKREAKMVRLTVIATILAGSGLLVAITSVIFAASR